MKTFLIFRRIEEGLSDRIGQYQSEFKDDSSTNRNYTDAEPLACHIEVPEGLDPSCVEPSWVELEAEQIVTLLEPVEAQLEKWMKEGEEDLLEDPQDESWTHIPAVEAQEGLYHTIPAVWGWTLAEDESKTLAKRQAIANANRDAIRALRLPLLEQADHGVNRLEDDGLDATIWRAWRKSLRECLDDLTKIDGNAKLTCENLVPAEFEFPAQPE